MARAQREMDGSTDTLLLAEALVTPRPGGLISGAPPGRLLLWTLDDTTSIAQGRSYSYWRFEGGELTLGWAAMFGSGVARLHARGTGYVGVDSMTTDVYVTGEPQPVFAITAQRVACPPRLTPAT
jgi:hypothetical protein